MDICVIKDIEEIVSGGDPVAEARYVDGPAEDRYTHNCAASGGMELVERARVLSEQVSVKVELKRLTVSTAWSER